MAAGAGKLVAQFSGCTGLEPTGGRATSIERRRPPMPELGVGSAGGHFPYAWAVPGSHRAGPCDPGGAPYGRTEYGRPRCARGRIPGKGKGLTCLTLRAPDLRKNVPQRSIRCRAGGVRVPSGLCVGAALK